MSNERVALTVKEAAEKARVSVSFFYKIVRRKGGPPIKRMGDRIVIPAQAFHRWLETPTRTRKG
jgi:excisionase family DNA binding protein